VTNFSEYVSGALALIVVIGIICLVALARPVPVEMWAGFSMVLGFFFGRQIDPRGTNANVG
jgi:hypothetical protein